MHQSERPAPEGVRDDERRLGNDEQSVELRSTEQVARRRRSGVNAVVELGHDGRGAHRRVVAKFVPPQRFPVVGREAQLEFGRIDVAASEPSHLAVLDAETEALATDVELNSATDSVRQPDALAHTFQVREPLGREDRCHETKGTVRPPQTHCPYFGATE